MKRFVKAVVASVALGSAAVGVTAATPRPAHAGFPTWVTGAFQKVLAALKLLGFAPIGPITFDANRQECHVLVSNGKVTKDCVFKKDSFRLGW